MLESQLLLVIVMSLSHSPTGEAHLYNYQPASDRQGRVEVTVKAQMPHKGTNRTRAMGLGLESSGRRPCPVPGEDEPGSHRAWRQVPPPFLLPSGAPPPCLLHTPALSALASEATRSSVESCAFPGNTTQPAWWQRCQRGDSPAARACLAPPALYPAC